MELVINRKSDGLRRLSLQVGFECREMRNAKQTVAQGDQIVKDPHWYCTLQSAVNLPKKVRPRTGHEGPQAE